MIAVTGASGFLGRHIVNAIKNKGWKHVALIRGGSKRRERLETITNSILAVDFENTSSIASALKGCSAVVHVLGLINAPEDVLRHVNLEYTRRIADASLQEGIQKFIFISSVAAGMRHGPYGQTKFEAEQVLQRSGLPHFILRPAFIYGEGDQNNTALMLKVLKRFPVIPLLGGGNFKIQPIYVEDVVSVVLQALEKEVTNTIYNLAGPAQISLREILQILASQSGFRRYLLPIPLKPVQALMRVYGRLFPRTRLPVKQILELDRHEAFDISRTQQDFDFAPMTFLEGVRRMVQGELCVV